MMHFNAPSQDEDSGITFVPEIDPPHSVRIIDANETLLFTDHKLLGQKLGCPDELKLKTLVIVGNTGDGKSHTLNHAFCSGREVFITSASQTTCTLGVWAAYEPRKNYLLLDTEGLLGSCANQNRQRRLLLKALAVADVVIYRTMSDRLHSDMFTFLADASDAFVEHFRPELENLAQRNQLPWSSSQLGPAVVIFQETKHTIPLTYENTVGPNSTTEKYIDFLNERFTSIQRNADAFSTLRYVGVQTVNKPTDFTKLVDLVNSLMEDTTVRIPRHLSHIFQVLLSLNTNFSTELPVSDAVTFVQEYFTCPAKCLSCQARCRLGVNHLLDGAPHESRTQIGDGCQYNPLLQNKVYFCKACYASGKSEMLVPKVIDNSENTLSGVFKFIWAGYVLKCPRHGTVYRSRAYWSGNPSPENTINVQWQVVHVWPGETSMLQGAHSVGQLFLDGLACVSNQVSQFTSPSARLISDLIADSVAPPYWQPNAQIKCCACCNYEFPSSSSESTISCSSTLLPTQCQQTTPKISGESNSVDPDASSPPLPIDRMPRTSVAPSDDAAKHHCRSCGLGVCESCSRNRLSVPERGFSSEAVRICDRCFNLRKFSISVGSQKSTSSESEVPSRSKIRTGDLHCNGEQHGSTTSGRKVIEMLSATAGYIAPVFTTPKEMVKSLARPDYWQPDELCLTCSLCNTAFGLRNPIHHCRSCGCGVCTDCSQNRIAVPNRGLDWPSRVCSTCFKSLSTSSSQSLSDVSSSSSKFLSQNRIIN